MSIAIGIQQFLELIHLNQIFYPILVRSVVVVAFFWFGWFSFLLSIFIQYQLFVSVAHTHHSIDDIASHSIPFYSQCRRNITSNHIKNNYDGEEEEEDTCVLRRCEEERNPCFLLPFQLMCTHIIATQLFIDDILTESFKEY